MKKISLFFFLILVSFTIKAQLSVFNITANDIVYSDKSNLIYAVISGTDINYGNCLIAINPNSGNVLKKIYIGSEPLRIKLTGDQKYAYVSFSGIGYVKRIDLEAFVVDREILLGPIEQSTSAYALDFEVIPGSNEKIAVCRTTDIDFYNFYFVDLVLYDKGIIQPKRVNNFGEGNSYSICQLVARSDGKTLFGYNSKSDRFDCYYISVTDSGVVMQNSLFDSNLLETFGRIRIHDDTLYSSNGRVLTPFTSPAALLGICPVNYNYVYYSNQYDFTYSKYYNSYIFSNPNNHSLSLEFYNKLDSSSIPPCFIDIPEELVSDIYFVENLIEINDGRFALILSDHGKYKVLMFLDPLSAISYTDPTLTANSGNNATGLEYSTLNIKALDQVYNWKRSKLYAVTSGEDISYPDCILKINPITCQVEENINIGEEPFRIKLTSDENYAYVAFRKSNFIKRVNLSTFEVDKVINLVSEGYYKTLFASDFEIIPGTNDKIVVCRASAGDYDSSVDLALYDDTVLNPNTISQYKDLGIWISQIVSKSDGKLMMGFNSQSTGFDCYLIEINENGLEIKEHYNNLVQSGLGSSYFPKIKIQNDEIIGSTGKVVDVFSNTPKIKGVCPGAYHNTYYGFTGFDYFDAYIFPSDNSNTGMIYLNFFSKKTFGYLGSMALKNLDEHVYVKSMEVIDKDHLSLILTKNIRYSSYAIPDEYMIIVDLNSYETLIRNDYSVPDNSIVTFPNPTDGILYFSPFTEIESITVYSPDGIMMLSKKTDLSQIDLGDLNNGIYIVRIRFKNETIITKKVLKY